MFISGMAVEKKKNTGFVRKMPAMERFEQQKNYGSELPDIYDIRSHTSNKIINLSHKQQKTRNSSHHKIYMSNKIKSKNDIQLQDHCKENQPLKTKKNQIAASIKKSKKLEINAKDQLLDLDPLEQYKILSFFRYYPLVIIAACGGRDQMMKNLTEKGQINAYFPKAKKLPRKGVAQFCSKLIKIAQLKGKYKYRQKFNHAYSAQLKALKYKRKQVKKKKESSSESSDDEIDKKQKCRDLQTWKKTMGVEGSKVFIVKGRYKDLRNALLERGWVENQDKNSLFYDLKWTTKVSDVNFQTVKTNQLVNHFNNNACLTSKYGICKSLRSIMYSQSIDVDSFFPKAFDLSDLSDFENYIEIYKWIFCESILKNMSGQQQQEQLIRVKLAYIITQRRLLKVEKVIMNAMAGKYNICTINEWTFLTDIKQANTEDIIETLKLWDLEKVTAEQLKIEVNKVLQDVKDNEPQFGLNGSGNIWIVKPAFLSRGRGIKCLSDFNDILDYSLGKETQYVVQKYIENPLIINKRKFDIRQWVIVEDYNPPKIWFYAEFYVRFCLEDYNPAKLNNKFAHLTNNSIQKNNQKVNAAQLMNESMWSMEELSKYVVEKYGDHKFKSIVSKMKQIVIATIISTQDQVYGRRNSFQLIGYDFMIDDNLNPWLIEINSSPSMDYSTPVTRRLVKMVLQDTVKVIIDLKKKKNKKKHAGLFKCIYSSQIPYDFKHYKISLPQE